MPTDFKTKDDVTSFLGKVHDILWDLTWHLKPAVNRILTAEQEEWAEKLQQALHDGMMRLYKDAKPKGWRKGQRVTIRQTFNATRTPSPVPGTHGKIDRLHEDKCGWWIVVSFTGEFKDADGTTWYPGDEPMNIWYKPDEIEKGWNTVSETT